MLSLGLRGWLVCVVCLVLTRIPEKSQTGGPPEALVLHFLPGVWEGSGVPLGRLRALLARLLALPGVFWGVSGAVLVAIGQEA